MAPQNDHTINTYSLRLEAENAILNRQVSELEQQIKTWDELYNKQHYPPSEDTVREQIRWQKLLADKDEEIQHLNKKVNICEMIIAGDPVSSFFKSICCFFKRIK